MSKTVSYIENILCFFRNNERRVAIRLFDELVRGRMDANDRTRLNYLRALSMQSQRDSFILSLLRWIAATVTSTFFSPTTKII